MEDLPMFAPDPSLVHSRSKLFRTPSVDSLIRSSALAFDAGAEDHIGVNANLVGHALELIPAEAAEYDAVAVAQVRRWVDSLKPSLQEVFDLIYRRDLSQREAASALQVSQPRIAKLHRQLLLRGRTDLARGEIDTLRR
jgi:DNA-directed RNA polymerase specialized sigma24 family protein